MCGATSFFFPHTFSSTNTFHYGMQSEAVMIELQRENSFGSIENPFWINFVKMQQAGCWRKTQCLLFQVWRSLALPRTTFILYDCFFKQNPSKKEQKICLLLWFANGYLRKQLSGQRRQRTVMLQVAVQSEGHPYFPHVTNFPLGSWAQCPPRSL